MWVKKAEKSWAKSLQLNMLQNTILNNQDKLFIPTTPKQLLLDGYFVGTMKAAQGAQGLSSDDESEEKEEPTGMYSLMARVWLFLQRERERKFCYFKANTPSVSSLLVLILLVAPSFIFSFDTRNKSLLSSVNHVDFYWGLERDLLLYSIRERGV